MNQAQVLSLARWLVNSISGGVIAYTASKSPAAKSTGLFISQLVTGPDVIAALALGITWLWGHLTHSDSAQAASADAGGSKQGNMFKVLLIGGLLAMSLMFGLTACKTADLNSSVFNSEQIATDGATQATHAFNLIHPETDLSTNVVAERETIYAADKDLAKALAVLDALRLRYATNSAGTNATAILDALAAVQNQSTNIVNLVHDVQIQTK